jgi:ABC-type transport system involved in cytochrome c biogenesis permease subunit
MLYIHPPLAILGYVFIVISFVFTLFERRYLVDLRFTRKSLYLTWFFNLMGLVTGMIWAEIAWGSYWSWDPKETVTLLLFISVCLSAVFYDRSKKISFMMLMVSLVIVVVNILISAWGLHSYL